MSDGRNTRKRRRQAARLRRDLERLARTHGLHLGEPLAWLERGDRRSARAALDLAAAAVAYRDARARLGEARAVRERRLEPLVSARDVELAAAAEALASDDQNRLADLLSRQRERELRWGPVLDVDQEVQRLEQSAAPADGAAPAKAHPSWLGERGQAALRRRLSRDESLPEDVPALALATARRDVALAAALYAAHPDGEVDGGWATVAEARDREVRARVDLLEQELAVLRAELNAAQRLAAALEAVGGGDASAARVALARLIDTKELAARGLASDVETLDAEQAFERDWQVALHRDSGECATSARARDARERLREASAAVLNFGLLGSQTGRMELEAARRQLSRALRTARQGHERQRHAIAAACAAHSTSEGHPIRAVLAQWRRTRVLRAPGDPVELDSMVADLTADLVRVERLLAEPSEETDPPELAAAWVRHRALHERLEVLDDAHEVWVRGGARYDLMLAALIDAAERELSKLLTELLRNPEDAAARPELAAVHADLERVRRAECQKLAAEVSRVFSTRACLEGSVRTAPARVRALGLVETILGE